jgi:curved DNA-binding protein CbpA
MAASIESRMQDQDRERLLEWNETLDVSTYYEILGVLEIADEAAIRQAFHEFSGAFHPDAHPDADPELAHLLRRLFQRGAEAYRVLLRPDLRADYDLELAKGNVRLGIPSMPPTHVPTVRSLDELCASAAGKLYAKRADQLLVQGDLAAAKRQLFFALRAEEDPDPELRERIDAIDLALFARGG